MSFRLDVVTNEIVRFVGEGVTNTVMTVSIHGPNWAPGEEMNRDRQTCGGVVT